MFQLTKNDQLNAGQSTLSLVLFFEPCNINIQYFVSLYAYGIFMNSFFFALLKAHDCVTVLNRDYFLITKN